MTDEALVEKIAMALLKYHRDAGFSGCVEWEQNSPRFQELYKGTAIAALSVLRAEGRLVEQGMRPEQIPMQWDGTNPPFDPYCYCETCQKAKAVHHARPRKPVSEGSGR